MRVRHLLSMSTGHAEDTTAAHAPSQDGNWARALPGPPGATRAGHPFPLQHRRHLHALGHRAEADRADRCWTTCAAPVRAAGHRRAPTWETCPRGINTGGWGLSVKTEDIARFGQLYLQNGKWQGRQLVPEAWVDAGHRAARSPTAATRTATGSRATATSSGAAATAPTAATARSASTAS